MQFVFLFCRITDMESKYGFRDPREERRIQYEQDQKAEEARRVERERQAEERQQRQAELERRAEPYINKMLDILSDFKQTVSPERGKLKWNGFKFYVDTSGFSNYPQGNFGRGSESWHESSALEVNMNFNPARNSVDSITAVSDTAREQLFDVLYSQFRVPITTIKYYTGPNDGEHSPETYTKTVTVRPIQAPIPPSISKSGFFRRLLGKG